MYIRDTIAAIATPIGSGGIGIVRISGPDSSSIASSLFRSSCCRTGGGFESHRLFYGRFIEPQTGQVLDEGMCVLMQGPRSYTREDVVELQCHGSTLVVRRLLEAALGLGARLAEPGEFTKRAFLNGRIDLSQAEAIADIITSRTDKGLAIAQSQRMGGLARVMGDVQQQLRQTLALVEAYVDFPEDEVDQSVIDLVEAAVSESRTILDDLVQSYGTGRILRHGVSVLLLGLPNAGKSSLLNALTGEESAIVSSIPGTTRDVKEEQISVLGLPVTIIDAAGIRSHVDDIVEEEGVRRAVAKINQADLVLHLVDAQSGFTAEDQRITELIGPAPHFIVMTKKDLEESSQPINRTADGNFYELSVRTGAGIQCLKEAIYSHFIVSDDESGSHRAMISNVRHLDALRKALDALGRFSELYAVGGEPELVSLELRSTLSALGEICGETTTDDLLDLIFSKFCIGK